MSATDNRVIEVSKPADISAQAWIKAINSGATTQAEIEAVAQGKRERK